jgi:hypothetical protein
VVDQLRLYLHRPLRDGDRPRLFVIAVAVIAAGVAVLSLLDDAGPSQPRDHTPWPRAVSTAASVPGPTTNPVAMPDVAPSEEGLPTAATKTSPAEIAAAKRTARRFLTGYLAFSYDRAPASATGDIGQALERELAEHPPRVSARERARHPRVKLLQSEGVSPTAASLLALVDDGARSYTLTLELAHRAAGWIVTGVRS